MPFVDWGWVLKIQDHALQSEARGIATAILLVTAFSFPAGVSMQVRFALQEGVATKSWELVGAISTILAQIAARIP